MPTYQSRCKHCDSLIDFVRKIDERDDTPICCGEKTSRQLVTPMIPAMGIADHYRIDSTSGRTFYGAGEYKKYLKDNDLLPTSELAGEAKHQRTQNERARREKIREDVTKVISTAT